MDHGCSLNLPPTKPIQRISKNKVESSKCIGNISPRRPNIVDPSGRDRQPDRQKDIYIQTDRQGHKERDKERDREGERQREREREKDGVTDRKREKRDRERGEREEREKRELRADMYICPPPCPNTSFYKMFIFIKC